MQTAWELRWRRREDARRAALAPAGDFVPPGTRNQWVQAAPPLASSKTGERRALGSPPAAQLPQPSRKWLQPRLWSAGSILLYGRLEEGPVGHPSIGEVRRHTQPPPLQPRDKSRPSLYAVVTFALRAFTEFPAAAGKKSHSPSRQLLLPLALRNAPAQSENGIGRSLEYNWQASFRKADKSFFQKFSLASDACTTRVYPPAAPARHTCPAGAFPPRVSAAAGSTAQPRAARRSTAWQPKVQA